MQKEIPLLFSTPMVQAILAGRKTQTRRTIKPQPIIDPESGMVFDGKKWMCKNDSMHAPWQERYARELSRWQSGDLLYVRESWRPLGGFEGKPDYSVMRPSDFAFKANEEWNGPWKPSIHMPKAAARIWLEVTDVRVERLQEITEEDAVAEGILRHVPVPGDGRTRYKNYNPQPGERPDFGVAVTSFTSLWQSINGPESWDANPWVWVVSFKVLSTSGRP